MSRQFIGRLLLSPWIYKFVRRSLPEFDHETASIFVELKGYAIGLGRADSPEVRKRTGESILAYLRHHLGFECCNHLVAIRHW
jgi:hypothetical protein